jgi:hypothetical protein
MILIGRAADTRGRRIDVPIENGARLAGKTDWLVHGRDAELSPNVFLAELPPGSVLDTHFHRENQFQLFVRGEGSLGRHAVAPITVHYAGAYTGYGPLAAGESGVDYFTIRPVYDTGAHYLPAARAALVPGPRRTLHSKPRPSLDAQRLRGLKGVEVHELIALQTDRIAARLVRLPPHGVHEDLDPRGSGGQFLAVLGGSLAYGDDALRELDFVFVSADESAFTLRAQDVGAEVVLMQLPVKAAEYAGHGWSHAQAEDAL